MRLWVILAFYATFLHTVVEILIKHLSTRLDEYTVGWIVNAATLPLLWVILLSTGLPSITPQFWLLFAFILPLGMLPLIFYFKAFKTSPIEDILPFTCFSPLAVSIGAFFFLHETLSLMNLVAILLLIAGAYVMQRKRRKSRYSLFSNLNKGSMFILFGVIISAVTIPLGKVLSLYSSTEFYTALLFTMTVIFFTPIFLLKRKSSKKKILGSIHSILLVGIVNALFVFTQWKAFHSGPVGAVNAIDMFSVLLSIAGARIFLKEKRFLQHALGASIMVAGAILILLQS